MGRGCDHRPVPSLRAWRCNAASCDSSAKCVEINGVMVPDVSGEEVERYMIQNNLLTASDAAPDASVLEALSDDLNTVAAVQALHQLAQAANADASKLPVFAASAALLGLLPEKVALDAGLSADIEAKVALRLSHLKAKDFAAADVLRDELTALGVQLKDGKDKDTGERITTWELKR